MRLGKEKFEMKDFEALAWVLKPAIFRMYLRKALPEIPVTGGRKQPVWDFTLQKKWRMI